eukprot:8882037-Pyramimonas_sp.AAC.1
MGEPFGKAGGLITGRRQLSTSRAVACPALGLGSLHVPAGPSQEGVHTDPGPGMGLARIGDALQG